MLEQLQAMQLLIKRSKRIVLFSGAGVSTNSGIPDFRSAKGLFVAEQGYHYSPEQIVSHSFYRQFPKVFFEFYFDKLVHRQAKPNVAHRFAQWLETFGKEVTVVTQNIDGLHQQAGSTNVLELHGSVWRNTCTQCAQTYDLNELTLDQDGIPRCIKDGAIVKPDVVLYEESLDEAVLTKAIQAIASADLMIIAGTSLVVYPAAGLVNYFSGEKIIVVNQTAVPIQRKDVLTIQQEMGAFFKELMEIT
ncbi:NAD-dependent protein deacylase [Tuanshanicoccus lijuaniae]|uniref:NAD-dependent protein deacylase n=1 Tax=Aerococcaceae bacterium zg-1292 TaxID=2774330 RepID=UPI0019387A23|nr:NAD-dependent protein deacylase [Aerococcaceae bacterium zg-1292]QQA36730.1 NAD-dependent protein deacylase [Aerococcaceae bacterium zg-1292]